MTRTKNVNQVVSQCRDKGERRHVAEEESHSLHGIQSFLLLETLPSAEVVCRFGALLIMEDMEELLSGRKKSEAKYENTLQIYEMRLKRGSE